MFKKKDSEKKGEDSPTKTETQEKKPGEKTDSTATKEKVKVESVVESPFLPGDYTAHIYIQDVRGLGVGDGTCDIIASITAFEETKYSKVYKDVGHGSSLYFAEHFFFDTYLKDPHSANEETIKVAFFNHKKLGMDSVIGKSEILIGEAYKSKDHVISHQWGFLQHPKKNFDQIAGFFKFSLNVARAGEPRLNLGDQKKLATENGKLDLLYPPEIKLTKYQLKLKLARGKTFIPMDSKGLVSKGKCDPFAIIQYNGMELKSSIENETLEPVWNQEFFLPVFKPTVADKIIVSFLDYDAVGNNDYIGALCYRISDILANKYPHPFWECIYGGPKDAEDKEQQKMENSEPLLGSYLKGEVLLSWSFEEVELTPFLKTEKSKEPIMESSLPCKGMELRVKVGYMFNCYSQAGSQHSILVKWGKFELTTQKKKNDQGVIVWNEAGCIKPLLYFHNLSELPDVFVYLLHPNGKVMSYKRIKVENLMKPETPETFYFLEPEKCNNKDLRDDQGGMLNIRIAIQSEEEWKDIESKTNWSLKNLQKYSYSPITIIANIFQAKKLAAADSDGQCDPLVLAYHFGNTTQTDPYPRTVNPVWNKRLLLQTYTINGSIPPIILTLYDFDEATLVSQPKFEFIGSLLYFFQQKDIATSQTDIPKPEWYKINYSSDIVMGQLLCSFTVLSNHEKIPRLLPITVPLKRHYIKINVLGLRDLESLGIFPIRRAFIKMNEIKSIDSAKDSVSMDIGTQPKDMGPNPNIGSVINFQLNLPADPNLMPLVTFLVFDKVLVGKSLNIGAFDLDLGVQSLITKARILKKIRTYLLKSKGAFGPERAGKLIEIMKTLKSEIYEEKKNMVLNETEAEELKDEHEHDHDHKHKHKEKKESGHSISLSQFVNSGEKKLDKKVNAFDLNQLIVIKPDVLFQKSSKVNEDPSLDMLKKLKLDLIGEKRISISNIDLKFLEKAQEEAKKEEKPAPALESDSSPVRASAITEKDQEEGDEEETAGLLKKRQSTVEQPQISEGKKRYNSISKKERKKYSEVFVLEPEFQFYNERGVQKKREVNVPDLDDYMELGHGDNKHYRYLVPTPLESAKIIGSYCFLSAPIFRGKNVGDFSLLDKIMGRAKNNYHQCGTFKGSLQIMSKETMELCKPIENEPALAASLGVPFREQDFKISPLDSELLAKNDVLIQIYVIDANVFESFDIGSDSDPYIKIYLGNKEVVNDRGNFISDRNNPQFMKMFTVDTTIPGPSKLSIQLWDMDPIGRDEFIGETYIDIENRFFDSKFRELVHVPIETRDIKHPSSNLSKGTIRLWTDIYNKGNSSEENYQRIKKVWNIAPAPEVEYQVRVIVWEVYDAPMADIEGTSDLYVTGNLNGLSDMQQKTDTHYRSQNGFGGFNWRMVWNVKIDQYSNFNTMNLNFKIFDRDLLSANDYLAEATISLGSFIKDACLNESRSKLYGKDKDDKEGSEKVYVRTIPNSTLKKSDQELKTGLLFSVELLPLNMYTSLKF